MNCQKDNKMASKIYQIGFMTFSPLFTMLLYLLFLPQINCSRRKIIQVKVGLSKSAGDQRYCWLLRGFRGLKIAGNTEKKLANLKTKTEIKAFIMKLRMHDFRLKIFCLPWHPTPVHLTFMCIVCNQTFARH